MKTIFKDIIINFKLCSYLLAGMVIARMFASHYTRVVT